MTHDEPHPLLAEAATLSLATQTARTIHHLSEQVSHILELITLLRGLKGIKAPDKWGEQYSTNKWKYLIDRGEYAAARMFILAHHV